jgi:putative ABC transport system substrate-binding protein
MRRRDFVALAGSAAFPWALVARAQPAAKVYRIGLVFGDGPISWLTESPYARAFVQAMHDLGYVEGQNLTLERRTAEGKVVERSGEIVEDLIHREVDVIVVGTTRLAREMKRATNAVPIVMAASVDPVAMGVVPDLARPGGNVTGFSAQAGPEIDAKRLQLLKDGAPKISSVAFLGTRFDWGTTNAQALRDAAQLLGLDCSWLNIRLRITQLRSLQWQRNVRTLCSSRSSPRAPPTAARSLTLCSSAG